MILKLIIVFCSIVLTQSLHRDHIEIGRQFKLLKNIPEEIFTDSIKSLKINFFDLPDLSGLQNITTECVDDLVLIDHALNRSGSDQVPSDFRKTVIMSK